MLWRLPRSFRRRRRAGFYSGHEISRPPLARLPQFVCVRDFLSPGVEGGQGVCGGYWLRKGGNRACSANRLGLLSRGGRRESELRIRADVSAPHDGSQERQDAQLLASGAFGSSRPPCGAGDYGQASRVWVMDRGMASAENIAWLRTSQRRYLI